jgi:alkylation response protein AidB-like acyl-CoA dehydrogenase
MHDVDGNRIDRAQLSPAHADLLKRIAFINRPPYEGGSWHQHFAYGYLLADPGLYCSLIVTNQTAYAIYKYLPDQKQWLEPLLSGEVWGATWMTRRTAAAIWARTRRWRSGRRRLETVRRRQVFREQRRSGRCGDRHGAA